jgi:hypothetical protein
MSHSDPKTNAGKDRRQQKKLVEGQIGHGLGLKAETRKTCKTFLPHMHVFSAPYHDSPFLYHVSRNSRQGLPVCSGAARTSSLVTGKHRHETRWRLQDHSPSCSLMLSHLDADRMAFIVRLLSGTRGRFDVHTGPFSSKTLPALAHVCATERDALSLPMFPTISIGQKEHYQHIDRTV